MRYLRLLALVAGGMMLFPPIGCATPIYNYAYGGNLTSDDQVQVLYFYISAASDVKIYTLSYTGGTNFSNGYSQTNLAGTTVDDPHGFPPVLSLFSIQGAYGQGPGGMIGKSAGSPGMGGTTALTTVYDWSGTPGQIGANEAYIAMSLTAGWYIVTVSEAGNEPPDTFSLGGFSEAGQGNFTAGSCGNGLVPFCEGDVQKTGLWAVDILNVDSSGFSTPEPATWEFLAGGLLLIGSMWLRRRMSRPVPVSLESGFPSRTGPRKGPGRL